nr:MAG TPA: hypothetical protein [Caudoviricetes sp.]DAU48221.1 MAG TPA: hypothetical protein [Bacteriophage sp.]
MELKIPQTYGERRKAAEFIRRTLVQENLRNNWLIQQLAREGFFIKPPTVCDALALRSQFPKTDEFLGRAERICKKYAKSCFGQTQSES